MLLPMETNLGCSLATPPLASIDWGSVAGFLCLAAIVAAVLIMSGGEGPGGGSLPPAGGDGGGF